MIIEGLHRTVFYSTETSVDFQWTTQRYVPEERTLHVELVDDLACRLKMMLKDSLMI
jgi:hypothetical protein